MNTTENNKLIAEFMGWNKVDLGIDGYETPHSVTLLQADNMSFQTSWDWLMPVVDKCYQEHMSKHIADAVMTCDIDTTYKAVVEFINEYNKCTTIHH